MMLPERIFYLLCASEIGVVLVGLVNLPVAAVIQIIVPLIIFHDFIVQPNSYQPVLFVCTFALCTILFAALFLFFGNIFIFLLIVAGFSLISFSALRMTEDSLQQYYSGVT